MTEVPQSKLPVPVEVLDFDFLASDAATRVVVLEMQTLTNPVRFFLTKPQLEKLSSLAKIAATKIRE